MGIDSIGPLLAAAPFQKSGSGIDSLESENCGFYANTYFIYDNS